MRIRGTARSRVRSRQEAVRAVRRRAAKRPTTGRVDSVELIRNPRNRDLVRIVDESRFIASTDLYLISERSRQETSAALTKLRHGKHLRAICSAQRIAHRGVFARKTYILTTQPESPRGHLVHWLYIAHLRALFTKAARELGVDLTWSQPTKHRREIPDATLHIGAPCSRTWTLEVDNSTEGMSLKGIAGKSFGQSTLIVAFRSEERFKNLCALGGLNTWHGYFHDAELNGFNVLTDEIWWNGEQWTRLV